MTESSVVHRTFVIERNYPTTPQRVFDAFADKTKKRRWCVEGEGFTIEEFEMEFRVGGIEQSRFRFQDGPAIVIDAVYQDIVPDKRIVFVYTLTTGDKRMSSSLTTVELLPAKKGTDLIFTEQGAFFDGLDSARGREEGCRGLLEELAKELQNA
jgi:uncharacterized protein YndB with AHSA1/START domain